MSLELRPRTAQAPGPEVLFSAAEIAARIGTLADEIIADPVMVEAARPPLAVCALRGAFMFTADLMRALSARGLDLEVTFLQVASYGSGTAPQGPVTLLQDTDSTAAGRPVLLIDDILDTGHTLAFLQTHLRAQGATGIVSTVLLDKTERREAGVSADHIGFDCPNVFVVGYGMDADGRYRGLPYVGVL
ncbi:MAG: phosphoribosyltransferase [Alphaproteobacteria bacterium]